MNIEPNWEQSRVEQRRMAQRLAVKRLIILVVIVVLGYVIGYPVYLRFVGAQQAATAVTRLKSLSQAAIMYSQEADDHLPLLDYVDALKPHLRSEDWAICPLEGDYFGLNSKVAGLTLTEIGNRKDVVLFYVGQNDQPDFRYSIYSAVSFADGNAKRIETQDKQVWEPTKANPGE